MTSVPHTQLHVSPVLSAADQPTTGLRLRLKPKAAPTGSVDGAWWPRSRDLSAELPALVHVLGVRLGRVTRVAFPLDAWATTPRRITVAGGTVRLDGFHSQDKDVVHVSGSDHQRLSLLVVPPDAAAAAAHDAMMTASARGNADRPGQLLAAGGLLAGVSVPWQRRVPDDDAQSRWVTDGGSVHERG
jgi:uncharacterized protein DUF5994